jgi:opacity protein-like surface antigen
MIPLLPAAVTNWKPARAALLIASLVAVGASTARAQGRPAQEEISPFSALYGTVGSLLIDVGKLNVRFERPDLLPKTTGFDAISNDAYTTGIGGYFPVMGRLLVGGEFVYGDVGQESSPSGKTNRLQTQYGMATFGYTVYNTWKLQVYGSLGLGAGQVALTLRNRSGGKPVSDLVPPTFDEIIASPSSESIITGTYVMVQPGIGFDYLFLRNPTAGVGITIGLRFSQAITPNRTTWTYQKREVFGAPDAAPTGGTLRVQVGIGGFKVAKKK